ncbi:uncharacterized protein LOC127281461 [Leptopilina boulardi]|uniref:uncharacterized protein LOC127281461 n=1 Tax=Leptopilina boulardi TaxID=63433 RepID=UPI0021F583CF|nr:uncharacterized protein LOC127281461 [Leptopilina boulardi]
MAEIQDKVKSLIRKRSTHKAQITNYKKFLEEYKKLPTSLIKLNVRLEKFKASFENFDQVSDDLETLDEASSHDVQRFEIEEDYINILTEFEELKAVAQPNTQSGIANISGSQDANTASNSASRTMKRRVKLPEASLPKFSGKYEDWLSFKDAFTSMIHDQEDLSNVEKLQYLKSAVVDEAANKIKTLAITDGNYDRAWNLLKSAYADKRLIISRHLSLLLRLPKQERETAEGLRRLADETQQHLESLKTLDIKISEEIVIQILEEKLFKITAEKWEETLTRDTFPKLDEMIEFLYKVASRVSKRERDNNTQKSTQPSNSGKPLNNKNTKNKSPDATRQAFVSKTEKTCSICREAGHPVYKCNKFRALSVPKRIQAAKEATLCLNCLRSHGDKPCNFSNCLICSEPHNTLLHDSKTQGS